ncbi:MAG: 3-deoxy-D-manno-octulosonic acid transferase, partial [Deltaproteobacteria bacterium]|nr:3-deoxy-D-manno-octulosonic acid transferase [Deltaproteobacteria bacterium]
MLRRLGKGLDRDLAGFPTGRPRIWIHALSVGETASARSMIKELRQRMPDAVII